MQYTLEQIKEVAFSLLNRLDNTSKDEWYTTEFCFANYGIQMLLEELVEYTPKQLELL